MASDEQLSKLEAKYDGYTVNDRDGDKIGKVDELFVDETDREEYIGVKMGLLGLSGTTMIPMEMARIDEQDRVIEVDESKERVKDAPTYSNDYEVNDEFEDRIRSYFGLGAQGSSGQRGSYGGSSGDGMAREDADRGEADREGRGEFGGDREGREGARMDRDAERGDRGDDREGGRMDRDAERGDRGDYRDDREGGRVERAEPESRGGEPRDMESRGGGSRDIEGRGERESREPESGRSGEERGRREEEEDGERMRVRRRTSREESSSFEQEEEEERFSR